MTRSVGLQLAWAMLRVCVPGKIVPGGVPIPPLIAELLGSVLHEGAEEATKVERAEVEIAIRAVTDVTMVDRGRADDGLASTRSAISAHTVLGQRFKVGRRRRRRRGCRGGGIMARCGAVMTMIMPGIVVAIRWVLRNR